MIIIVKLQCSVPQKITLFGDWVTADVSGEEEVFLEERGSRTQNDWHTVTCSTGIRTGRSQQGGRKARGLQLHVTRTINHQATGRGEEVLLNGPPALLQNQYFLF